MTIIERKIIEYLEQLNTPQSKIQLFEDALGIKENGEANNKKNIYYLTNRLNNLVKRGVLRKCTIGDEKLPRYCLADQCADVSHRSGQLAKTDAVKIGIICDTPLLLHAIESVIGTIYNAKIILSVSNREHFLKAIKFGPRPHVCLLAESGLLSDNNAFVKTIFYHYNAIKVLAIGNDHEYTVNRMIYDRAYGFLPVDCEINHLRTAIMALYRKKQFWRYKVCTTRPLLSVEQKDSMSLTEKQLQFLRLSVQGLSYDQMAKSIGVSVRTAESHRDHLFELLSFNRRSDLELFAVKAGLVHL